MLRWCARRCAPASRGKIPSPGSSLLNPRSQRAKERRAMAMHDAQLAQFEDQAIFAGIGGADSSSPAHPPRLRRSPKSKKQRKSFFVRALVGRDVAERVKSMTDAEWESVPMDDKHAFTKYMSELLRTHPSRATEQQRRRYFETTLADPRDLDPHRTVHDEYERVKLGLPVHLKHPQRSLGVTQAIFEAGDASLFEPAHVEKLEESMIQVKQQFADYVRQRREGVSTEAARRQLAHMTAALNVETQKHLSHMFKYAEEKVRKVAVEERKQQLGELARLRQRLTQGRRPPSSPQENREEDENEETNPKKHNSTFKKKTKRGSRRAALKKSMGQALGLDLAVVENLLTELDAQEKFMQFCEVFARLTLGRGFHHGPQDESLDAYTESLHKLYSVDANKLSTLEVVQYLAAKEDTPPVEWAKRWYERLLRVPLEHTPEYRRLQQIREEEVAALTASSSSSSSGHDTAPLGASASHQAAQEAEKQAATTRTTKAIRLAEKMFMKPDDARLQSLHEKRLKYIAYLQMQRQIRQARENAKIFAGVEASEEAAECRNLYQQLLERREGVVQLLSSSSEVPNEETNHNNNIYEKDADAAALFEQISTVTEQVIAQYTKSARVARQSAAKAATVARLLDAVHSDRARNLQTLLNEKKQKVAARLLQVLETDVKSDLQWLDAMEEAERPPLLPVPEGMSYVSAADVMAWKDLRTTQEADAGNPFSKHNNNNNNKRNKSSKKLYSPELFGQTWKMPDKPLLFWGTGTQAVQQALQHAAEDADRRRRGEPLAPPYPCAENPWGWRLVKDILDD